MAITAVEEGQIRGLLAKYSELSDIADASEDILSAYGYGDVRVIDLDTATVINLSDVFYCAQGTADVKMTWSVMSNYMASLLTPIIEAGISDAKFYYTGQF